MTAEDHDFASVRPPLSIRGDQAAIKKFYEPKEDLAPETVRAMLSWLERGLKSGAWDLDRFARTHDIALGEHFRWEVLTREIDGDERLLLDVVDHALGHPQCSHQRARVMEGYLVEARSIWHTAEAPDGRWQLQHRQPPELVRLAEQAASSGDRAGEHLREAWSKAFARDADPAGAVHAANKAIEAAAKPVVIPDDPTATTGKMLKALRDKPDKWISDLGPGGVSAVVELMDAMWKSQIRHGDESQPASESAETAEMIVHASVLLMHWFQNGRIRHRDAQ